MTRDDALHLADLIRDLINHNPRTPDRDTIADAIIGGYAQRVPKPVGKAVDPYGPNPPLPNTISARDLAKLLQHYRDIARAKPAEKLGLPVINDESGPESPLPIHYGDGPPPIDQRRDAIANRYRELRDARMAESAWSVTIADDYLQYDDKVDVVNIKTGEAPGKGVMVRKEGITEHHLTDHQREAIKNIRLTEHKPSYRITDIRRNPNLVSTFEPTRPLISFEAAWPGNTTLRFPNEVEVELGLCNEEVARALFGLWQNAWADEAKRHIS